MQGNNSISSKNCFGMNSSKYVSFKYIKKESKIYCDVLSNDIFKLITQNLILINTNFSKNF